MHDPSTSVPHFVSALGLRQWAEGATTHGRAVVRPEHCAPGTDRPRIAVLATMVDIVAGSQPDGPINPTVDLHLQVMAFPPMSTVHLTCDVLRAGRTLFVGETRLYADGGDEPFARSLITFMNRPMVQVQAEPDRPRLDGSAPAGLAGRMDDLLSPRFDGDRILEVDAAPHLTNGPGGTLQGGVVALMAELVTERAVSAEGAMAVTDLDIRYLNRVRSGPVRAVAELLPSPRDAAAVQVRLTDAGDHERLVAVVATTARPC